MKIILFLYLLNISTFSFEDRVISTSPAITYALEYFGLSKYIVGVDSYSKIDIFSNITKIGTVYSPLIETIIRLKPKIVLIDRIKNNTLKKKMDLLKIKNLELSWSNLENIKKSFIILGSLFNKEKLSSEFIKKLNDLLKQKILKGLDVILVLDIVIKNNKIVNFSLLGKNGIIGEVFSNLGANIIKGSYFNLSIEKFLKIKKEYIYFFIDNKKKERKVLSFLKEHKLSKFYFIEDLSLIVPGVKTLSLIELVHENFRSK